MRMISMAVLAVAGAAALSAQTPLDVSGRWRLTDTATASSSVPQELFVKVVSTIVNVERGFLTGVRFTNYRIAPAGRTQTPGITPAGRGSTTLHTASWQSASLVLTTRASGPAVAMTAVDHEEIWSVEGDTLRIQISDRALGAVRTTSQLKYTRVPRRAAVALGENLLENADAKAGPAFWLMTGDAKIEDCDGRPCFVVRNGGSFRQSVLLPAHAGGKYVVLVGSGASERVNPDGAISGLPALYATVSHADGVRIVGHLQTSRTPARPTAPNVWFRIAGVFLLADGAERLSFQLNQTSVKNVPQNGSAARFDRLGVYLFATEREARAFLDAWEGR